MQTPDVQATPAKALRRTVCVRLTVALTALSLSGCEAVVRSPPASQVRIIAASPDAPGIDVYLNNNGLAYNLGFGSVTSYIPVDAGTHTVAVDTAGTRQTLIFAKNTFNAANQYTVLVGNAAANLQTMVLKDQAQAAPPGQISLRLVDHAIRSGALEVYLVPAGQKFTAVTPLVTNLTFATNTGYLNVPTGTYSLVILPSGTMPARTTAAMYTGAQVIYSGGSATTMILIDQQQATTPGVQILSTTDYALPAVTQ